MYIYDSMFQSMAAVGSAHAARRIISAMRTVLPVRSVIDIGCARGTWLREWQAQGVADILGIDGDYVDRGRLEIDPRCFVVHDLATPFNLRRQFDVAQSLEVAEHLPPSRAVALVADIVAHAPVVLFSAAPPGQGGENHLNERPYDYWQSLFLRHDYVAIDCLRPLLVKESNAPKWYIYNIMVYARRDIINNISPFARQFLLRDGERVADISPAWYRVRKCIIRALPRPVCNQFARWNARRFSNVRAQSS
jgi:hypothetical protein